jgi:hypothetical protein
MLNAYDPMTSVRCLALVIGRVAESTTTAGRNPSAAKAAAINARGGVPNAEVALGVDRERANVPDQAQQRRGERNAIDRVAGSVAGAVAEGHHREHRVEDDAGSEARQVDERGEVCRGHV